MGSTVGSVLDETDPGLLEAMVACDLRCSLVDGNQVLVWLIWFSSCLLQGCMGLLQLCLHVAICGLNFLFCFVASALKALHYIFWCAYSSSCTKLWSMGLGLSCFILLQELLRLICILLAELSLQENIVYWITLGHVALQHHSSCGIGLAPRWCCGIFKTELGAVFWVFSTLSLLPSRCRSVIFIHFCKIYRVLGYFVARILHLRPIRIVLGEVLISFLILL